MAVGLEPAKDLLPVAGIRIATAEAGIRYKDRKDLVLMEIPEGSQVAGVFTRNAFCAAPVIIARQHLVATSPRFFLVNSGNANAGTGSQGMADALACCEIVAEYAGCAANEVLPFSTGVIGEPLPVEKFKWVMSGLVEQLDENNWLDMARTIMTTDTMPKGISERVSLSGGEIVITGVSKGAGMIRPDMATMLSYIATDAELDIDQLNRCHQKAVSTTFNRVTVDGDTSTNDACMLIATGKSGVVISDEDESLFQQALDRVYRHLAQALIRDGEGATKFVEIQVDEASDEQEALNVAYTVAHSPLVKTALFASDPNWGRILAAVGRAGLHELDIDKIRIHLDDVCIVENGARASSYTEEQGQAVMSQDEIRIQIQLGRGDESCCVWTTDFSFDYVKINAEYRT